MTTPGPIATAPDDVRDAARLAYIDNEGYGSRAGFDAAADVAHAAGLAAGGRQVVGDHHLPLLDLTADEVAALRALARDLLPGAGWVTPTLRSALDKLTTSTEEAP